MSLAIGVGDAGAILVLDGDCLDRLVFEKIARDPRLLQAFTQIFRRQQSPYTLLPAGRALGWIFAAALRGQPGLLRDFIARGRRNQHVLDELARRRRWLAALEHPARS